MVGKPGIRSDPRRDHGRRDDANEFTMPKGRRSELVAAQQANRDLRNRLNDVEWPLQKRIRELEVERDEAVARSCELTTENDAYRRSVPALVALLNHLLASGKTR